MASSPSFVFEAPVGESLQPGELDWGELLKVEEKPCIVPIPGATKLARLQKNIGAVALALSAADLQQINEAMAKVPLHGDRYPEHLAKMTGR